ncbi:MAG: DUF459 domain-containing protein [Pseudomonadota bacterium]
MRKFVRVCGLVILVASIALVGVGTAPLFIKDGAVAHAQAKSSRKQGFLERLFQPRKRDNKAKAPQRQTTQPRVAPKRAAPATAAAPAIVAVEKAENARRVLVVGDFVADGMAKGLAEAFVEVETVAVIRKTSGSSGFVRDDFYDWPAQIGAIIEEENPDIVVMQIGSNDRQAMRIGGSSEKVRTEAWNTEYVARVTAFANAVREQNKLLVWVGAPPFKFKSMSADMLAFNEMYRTAVEDADGYFVDIWDGFVDENGNFVQTGDDIKGQKVRLRVSDGINFTKAGRRKMAFYVERQLRVLLGDAASPLLTSLANNQLPMLQLPPLQTEAELERINPISFVDVELDGGASLLGDVEEVVAVNRNPLSAKSFRLRLIEDGLPPPAREGRAGDFRLRSLDQPGQPEG